MGFEERKTLRSLIITIRSTVLIYVSQISIVESKKLEVAGALKFEGDSATIDTVDVNDFDAQLTVLKAQVTNLFQIADSNDKVIECISKIEGLPDAEEPTPNKDLKKEADKVPAMCGQAAPPVKEVQKTSASIVKTCATATEKPSEAEVKSLLFIKKSLITFKQTFSSQITIFSQKLSDITGKSVTAASLNVQVISASGEIEEAKAIDITGGKTEFSVEFYTLRYEIMKSSLNSIERVITKITTITSITTDGAVEADSISAMDFALLIAQFTSSLSSGVITEEIITLSQKIIQAKVTSAPSKAILILLKSAASSAGSLQMTILSEIVVIKQTLMQVLVTTGISITSIKFTIQDFDAEGKITTTEESGGKSEQTTEQLTASMKIFETSQTTLMKVSTLLKATKEFDFTSITEVQTEVTMVEFMTKLTSFLMMVGKDMASSKVEEIGKELILMKMKSKGSVTMISKLTFIISTVTTYVVQVTTEITSVQSQIVYSTTTIVTYEEAQKQITFLTSSQEAFSSVSTAITTSMASIDKTATNSALNFFSDSQTFFITISTLTVETLKTGSNTVITTLSEKLVTASTGGVSPSSGKFMLIFQTIIQSITIFVKIIQIQIDVLKTVAAGTTPPPAAEVVPPESTTPGSTTQNPECLSLLESFRTLKENEIAVGQTMAIIEMISNNTEFSTFEPSMCDSYLGSGYGGDFGGGMGSGAPGPKGVPCGSDTPKKTSIILKIVKGLKTGLVDIEETSTFSTAQTIVEAVFKFKFETFSSSDLATLSADSDDLKNIFESIKAQQIFVSKKIEDSGCTTEDYYDAISIPPCQPSELPLKEELLMKLEGLFSNLEAAESTIEAVEAVIKGGSTNPTVTVDNFIVILDSLTAVLDLYNPCELFKLVIQQISSLLVVFSKTTFDATATQIIYLQNILIILIQIILDIIVQINIIQSQLSEITGSTVDPSSLIIFTIGPDGQIGPGEETTPMPSVLLPREEEAKIEEAISELKIAITNIEIIIEMIILIIEGTFTIDVSSEYRCDDFFGIVMEFLTLLIRGQFGEELEAAANKVIAVSSLSSACGSVTISYFKIVLLALIEINVNVIGALTVIVQRLIISRGLIVTINLEELYSLSFEDQTKTLELSLRQLREGCAMADEVSIGLESFLETVACGPDAEESKEIGNVIKKITDLTILMAFDIEDKGIINLAIEIQTLLLTLTGTTVNGKQCKSIEVLIIIIQNTVMTFVSQITILEQKNLQIGGELKFSISLPPVEDKEDYKRLEERNEAQLKGLMRCGDFTERSIQSIKQSFEVFEFEPSFDNQPCNGKEVLKKAQRVTAMCSSEVLPIDDVAENTKDLARCSSSLSRPLNEREVSSLEFILMSCGSFAVTFSSQITIVQQKLTVLTGQTVTAADLFLKFIGRDGSLYPALPLDIGDGDPALVPVNEIEIPDDEPWFKVGRELFLVKQWTEFRFAYFCSGPEFLMKVSSYFTMIGQGLFTSDFLYDATFDIIKCASQVNMEVSYRIILLL